MNVDHLDCLFQEYGYDVKERTASYRVYLLNQGMYHGAEIQIMDDDIDATPILDRYSKLGYHAKQQRFKSIEQAESYLFKGFFNTQTTANDINRRYTEFAANQVKHYCNCGIKYQYISMPYSIYSEGAEDTEAVLNKCGVMYHVFYRTKSEMSIKNKLEKKSEEYRKANKKMQDLLALRITLYFTDDVELVHNYLKSQSNFDSESVDEAEVDKFCPKRLNLIMRVPNNLQQDMKAAIKETGYEDLIDNTYEVQIRTILSEGWHEVEHDLRYKCKEEWNEFKEESRLLNGIYATLESSEWSMLTLFDRLSYSQYKNKVWNSMLRNKMRVRFADKGLSEELCKYLSNNNKTAKLLYRANRTKILKLVMEKGFAYPLTYDTVLHLINHIIVKDKILANFEDKVLKRDMDIMFGEL